MAGGAAKGAEEHSESHFNFPSTMRPISLRQLSIRPFSTASTPPQARFALSLSHRSITFVLCILPPARGHCGGTANKTHLSRHVCRGRGTEQTGRGREKRGILPRKDDCEELFVRLD